MSGIMIPTEFFLVVAGLFGLIIGSFLNVVIYRLHTGRSLNGSSHCESCGTDLRWYELLPVVSYLIQGGRCRTCSSYIRSQHVLVELTTAILFMVAYLQAGNPVVLGLLLLFVSLLVVVSVYDLHHLIIPDEFSFTLALVAVGLVGYQAWYGAGLDHLLWSLMAGLLSFTAFALLWWGSAGRWLGFGDAKLAVSLGIMVGIEGVFSLVVLSFWVGAALSLLFMLLLALMRKQGRGGLRHRVTMKSEIPFAPFLIVAFFLVYFWDADVLAAISALMEHLWS